MKNLAHFPTMLVLFKKLKSAEGPKSPKILTAKKQPTFWECKHLGANSVRFCFKNHTRVTYGILTIMFQKEKTTF